MLIKTITDGTPAEAPRPGDLDLVRYPSPAGDLAAYVSPDPGDGKKRPAIIRIFGGFDNGIGSTAWEPGAPANDHFGRATRCGCRAKSGLPPAQ